MRACAVVYNGGPMSIELCVDRVVSCRWKSIHLEGVQVLGQGVDTRGRCVGSVSCIGQSSCRGVKDSGRCGVLGRPPDVLVSPMPLSRCGIG